MRKFLLEESEYHTQPPLTEQMIQNAEKKLKVTLPKSYIELLTDQYNGGSLRFDGFSDDEDGHYTIYEIEGIGEEFGGILGSLETAEEFELPKGLIPYAGDGHYLYCFDYRTSGPYAEPTITHVYTEEFTVTHLADNFEGFIDKLFDSYHSYVFGFENVTEDDLVLMKKLSTNLNCTFIKEESQAKDSIFVSRSAVHPTWTDREGDPSRLLLYENYKYGAWSYPEYTSCNWYMIAMVSKDLLDTVFRALQDGLPNNIMLIHEPPAFWDNV
ncbi:SMI1/KNR4 family protein [Neobacillus mesonae]|nr:SMI1/KNR4 family protein [Neobacillus mesonae]